MCYYNGVKIKYNDFIRLKELEHQYPFEDLSIAVQSGFEYSNWPVIKPTMNGDWEMVKMEWGFLPFYLKDREAVKKYREGYKDEKGKFHTAVITLNAIGEELLAPHKMFRDSALRRRCIVLSSGFYEWRHVPQIGKSGKILKATLKYPYFIKPAKGNFFLMAGVWQPWTDKETGETMDTFAIVTTKANELMAEVHNTKKRMPTILPDDLAWRWLMEDLTENEIKEISAYQFPSELMNAYSIAKDFKTAPDPLAPYEYEDLPPLDIAL